VHARAVVAAAIDGQTGDVVRARLIIASAQVLDGSPSFRSRQLRCMRPVRPCLGWPAHCLRQAFVARSLRHRGCAWSVPGAMCSWAVGVASTLMA